MVLFISLGLCICLATDHNHQLWHNDGNGNHWVGFILEGTVSNKEAIGALVTVYAGGGQKMRYRKCPDGWNRQHMPWLHFGLGKNSKVDSVVVRWPMGIEEVMTNVAINQYHTVKESGTNSQVFPQDSQPPDTYHLEQNYPNPFNPQTTIEYSAAKNHQAELVIYNLQSERCNFFFQFFYLMFTTKSSARLLPRWRSLNPLKTMAL